MLLLVLAAAGSRVTIALILLGPDWPA